MDDRGVNTPDREIKPTETTFAVPQKNSEPEAVNVPKQPTTFADDGAVKPTK